MAFEDSRELPAHSQIVSGLDKHISLLVDSFLLCDEAAFFEEEAGSMKQKLLQENLILLILPACQLTLQHISSEILDKSMKTFDDALNGGRKFQVAASDYRSSLLNLFLEQSKGAIIKQIDWVSNKVNAKVTQHFAAKLSELTTQCEMKVKSRLYQTAKAVLRWAPGDTWPIMRRLVLDVTESAVSEFSDALSRFAMDENAKKNVLSRLEICAREVVEGLFKEEAGKALLRIKERFEAILNNDKDLMPCIWTKKQDFVAINAAARTSSLKLLSILAAIRLDDYADEIGDILIHSLAEPNNCSNKSSSLQVHLATNKWEKIPASKVLITPRQCVSLWSQVQKETEYVVNQAISAHKAKQC